MNHDYLRNGTRVALDFAGRVQMSPHLALDADVILCTQAAMVAAEGDTPVIATTNVGHLYLFADARRWQDFT